VNDVLCGHVLTGDRHMNIGNTTRKLALTEPGRREYLPVDDQAWERGVCNRIRSSCSGH
jgi:hypothetical protein